MQYQEAVAEARTLVKRSEDDQWRLAQLTWEVRRQGVSAKQWAEDIGTAFQHVYSLAKTWERYGFQSLETRPPFSQAYASVHTPGRFEEGEATGGMAPGAAARTVRNMPPEQQAEVARELLQRPAVAKQVMEDVPTAAAVSHAHEEVARERAERVDRVSREHSPGAHEHEKYLTARHLLHNARSSLALSMDAAREADMTDQRRHDLDGDLGDIESAIALYRSMLAGEVGFEQELAALLEQGR